MEWSSIAGEKVDRIITHDPHQFALTGQRQGHVSAYAERVAPA
jgi:hypothetical protein